jgi:hypothetical protein
LAFAANERFRVLAEHEFFAGAGLDVEPAPERLARLRRRSHRAAGVMALTGAVGMVAGAIALVHLPGTSRVRSSYSLRANVRSQGRRALVMRDARTRVRPAAARRAAPSATTYRPYRPRLRVVASFLRHRARPSAAQATGGQRARSVAVQPAPRPEVARPEVVRPEVPREVASATVARPSTAQQSPRPGEFSFER